MTTKEAVCKRIILSIFFLLVLCRTAGAQDARKGILSAADAGTCTANSTACSFLTIPSGSGGVTFTITANASANTIQFEATGDTEPTGSHTWVALNVVPSNGTTAVTSTTSTGTWQANIAGFTQVRMRCSTFVGGTTTTYINLSTASARSNGGGGGGSVTHTAGNLTAFHIMIGNGAADATVDSACVTNGTGALSGCTSISVGSGASAAGATATGGIAVVEATSTGWTPTAGQAYVRGSSVLDNFVVSIPLNGATETPLPVFNAVPGGGKCLQSSGVAGLVAEAAGACGTGAISGLTTGFLSKSLTATTIQNSLCDEGITVANALTCTDTAGILAPAFTATGATAGFIDFPQGADSGAVAPCNTATSICWEAPTSVTSYKGILPGAAATGIPHYANSANVITETISAINLASADVTGALPIGNVGSAGLSGTSPIAISAAGAISCGTCASSVFPVTVSGTVNSGGVPYFSSTTVESTSAALTANGVVLGGGAGAAPTVTTADSTTTHALFATAGAPAFRALVAGDLSGVPVIVPATTAANIIAPTVSGVVGLSVAGNGAAGNRFHVCDTAATCAATLDFYIDGNGNLQEVYSANIGSATTSKTYLTSTNCAGVGTAANPSVVTCSTASAGAFSCATAASTGTCQVNTTAVTANSEIHVWQVVDEGTRLSVTCNTASVLPTTPLLLSKSAGASFTITLGTIVTNPGCFDYDIKN